MQRHPRPSTPDAVLDHIVELVLGWSSVVDHPVRLGIDGPWFPGEPAASEATAVADAVADRLRILGVAGVRVSCADYLRPASLRLEYGHTDPDSFADLWVDIAALRREVLDPAGPGGSGSVLPALWDAAADRAVRAAPVPIGPGAVVVLDGPFLIGRGLPLDVTVHLRLSAAARARRAPESVRWTLPAYARHDADDDPTGSADLVVFADDPDRPAVLVRTPG